MQLPPAGLARCLRVCKNFNNILTNFKAPPAKKNAPKVRILDSEVIWMNSRKNTYSTMPRPLQGFTELEMLQLIGCQSCQTCGKLPVKPQPPPTTVFDAGPGETGVRVIWPFHLRICGSCFTRDALTVGVLLTNPFRVASNMVIRISKCFKVHQAQRLSVLDLLTHSEHHSVTSCLI